LNLANIQPLSYRWNITARLLLAFFGGFLWSSVFGALCATLFDALGWMPIPQGVHIMTMFSFLSWCAIAMWSFYEFKLSKIIGIIGSSTVIMYFLFLMVK